MPTKSRRWMKWTRSLTERRNEREAEHQKNGAGGDAGGHAGQSDGLLHSARPDARSAANQRRDGPVRHGAGAPDGHADPRAAEHAKPHAGHVAIQRPEHVGGLVERQSADNHAQNGGDCRAGRAKLADLHTGLQRGLSRAARRLDGQRRQRFAGAADRAGLLHRDDRRQILHRHAERRYGVPKPKRSHGGRHCGPRDAGQALFRIGAAQDSQRQHDGKRLYAAQGGHIRFGGAQIAGPSGGAGVLRGRRGRHLRLDDDQRCEGLPAGERTERRRTGGHADADEAIFRECEIRDQSGDDGEPGSDAHVERRHDGQRRLRFAGAAD